MSLIPTRNRMTIPEYRGRAPDYRATEWLNVKNYGAKANGTDDTAAFNTAIADAQSRTYGARIFVPPGVYSVTNINASKADSADFVKKVSIVGSGLGSTVLLGNGSGILVDALGRNYFEMSDITITAQTVYQTGLLLARSTTSQNCNNGRFANLEITGQYSIASLCSIAAESQRFVDCRFTNSLNTNGYCCFYTSSSNDCGLTSANGTLFASSNTDNRMFGAEFYAPYVSATPVIFSQGSSSGPHWSFYSPFIVVTSGYLVTYKSAASVFNGAVAWVSALYEGTSAVVHWLLGDSGGVNYFMGIRDVCPFYNIAGAGTQYIMNYLSTGGNLAYLRGSHIAQASPNGTVGNTMTVNVWAVDRSHIDILDYNASTVINVTSFEQNCFLRAGTVVEAMAAGEGYQGQTFGSAAPIAGTYAVGHIQWNTAPASAQPIGWVCTVAGTPGTWKAFGTIS